MKAEQVKRSFEMSCPTITRCMPRGWPLLSLSGQPRSSPERWRSSSEAGGREGEKEQLRETRDKWRVAGYLVAALWNHSLNNGHSLPRNSSGTSPCLGPVAAGESGCLEEEVKRTTHSVRYLVCGL